jgi:hypothetical protein
MLAMVHDDWICFVTAKFKCSTHEPTHIDTPKTKTSIRDSTDAIAEATDAAVLQRAGPGVLWKKTCSDKVYANMYRFGIFASKCHKAEYTKLENLQVRLGNLAVEQAKAK